MRRDPKFDPKSTSTHHWFSLGHGRYVKVHIPLSVQQSLHARRKFQPRMFIAIVEDVIVHRARARSRAA